MTNYRESHPLERLLQISLKRLLMWGIPISAVFLILPAPHPDEGLYWYTLSHLAILQLATFLLTVELAPAVDDPWFKATKRSWLASVASLIAIVVGFSALLTLATSAAARYDVSLQFLQLLSSLDIAWVVAAIYIGARVLWSRFVAYTVGGALLIACVASIAVYLEVVGFSSESGWRVDGAEMMRIVISSDVMAAIISLSVLLGATRRAQAIAQASPHS